MAYSKVGQYRLEFVISGIENPVREHVTGIWLTPLGAPAAGELPADITTQLKGGGYKSLQAVADEFGAFLRRMYAANLVTENFTLWHYVTEYQREFITAGVAVTGVVGQGAMVVAHQQTLTFRHANGGISKIVMLEANVDGNTSELIVPNAVGTDTERLAFYVLSADSPVLALDNSFAITSLRNSLGENEKIWRKVYRG